MREFTYTITDDAGIHARPAGLLVKEADKYSSDIQICANNERCADAKRLFSVMGLGIKKGDVITLKITGEDEDNAERELQKFFKSNL